MFVLKRAGLFSERDDHTQGSAAREGCRDGELCRPSGGNLSHCGGKCHIDRTLILMKHIVEMGFGIH